MNVTKTSLIAIVFTALFSSSFASADVIPPAKQMELNISAANVFCKENLVKVLSAHNEKAACVKPSTAKKLAQKGWSQPVDTTLIETIKNRIQIGQVNNLIIVKELGSAGRIAPNLPLVGYNFVFEVCANDKTIRAPEVLLKSDSEVKSVKLAKPVMANTCEISAAKIKAADTNSISATLVNMGGITERITNLEKTVTEYESKLSAEKSRLDSISKQEQKPDDYKQTVSDATNKIKELRKQLNNAREELNRYLFTFYAKSEKVSEYKTPLSFGGNPIEEAFANKLSVVPQIGGSGYNVVFEACAGQNIVRAPVVDIKSDIDINSVKLAEKISPNSCQIGTVKIEASSVDSITVALEGTAKLSNRISELENKITENQQLIADSKKALNELVRLAPDKRPADFDEKVTELSSKIADLRNQINDSRIQLHRVLAQFYQ